VKVAHENEQDLLSSYVGYVMTLEYGSSSTGIIVTSSFSIDPSLLSLMLVLCIFNG
jgi:hypothetical protein